MARTKRILASFSILCLILILFTLLVTQGCCFHSTAAGSNLKNQEVLVGYSGMAQFSENKYLVVHDTKGDEEGPRIGVLTVEQKRPPLYKQLQIDNLHDPDGRSRDLESACSLPGDSQEFLVAESGYRKGKYGRIFHIKVIDGNALIQHVFKLPRLKTRKNKPIKNNHEGMACVPLKDEQTLVILGERGGSKHDPNGVLRWAILNRSKDDLSWSEKSTHGIAVKAPGPWYRPKNKRDIAALHVDTNNKLWAVASEDSEDNGPFCSIIYQATTFTNDPDNPITLIKKSTTVLDNRWVQG